MERIHESVRSTGDDSQPYVVRRPRYPAGGNHRESHSLSNATHLAQRLGWLSLSLGFAEVVAPRLLLRLLGGNGRYANLVRLYGMRELLSGAMILAQGSRPRAAMWSRVAGDAVDIATLAAAGASQRISKGGVAFATASVLGVAALDVYCARELGRDQRESNGIRMTRSVIVNRPPHELYAFWRAFENFPRFMYHVRSVTPTGPGMSHWVVDGPAGTRVEWDSRITADTPNALIAWQSLEGAGVDNNGVVRFEPRPGNRGTIVRVDLAYRPPGGTIAKLAAMLFNESPEQQIYDDLHRFKQIVETGEIVRSEGSPHGMGDVLQEPGRPIADRGHPDDATRWSAD